MVFNIQTKCHSQSLSIYSCFWKGWTLQKHGLEPEELVEYYTSVIRSVLEYACPAWFTNIKDSVHMWELEHIQVRAMKIIFENLSYKQALTHTGLCTVKKRLTTLCTNIFKSMQNENHRLHYLLPEVHNRRQLRQTTKYEFPKCRTEHFKNSFVMYSLFNYQ